MPSPVRVIGVLIGAGLGDGGKQSAEAMVMARVMSTGIAGLALTLGLAAASPAAAQLPSRIATCLAARGGAVAVVCPSAWQAYGVTEQQWMLAIAHYAEQMIAEDRATEALDSFFRIGNVPNKPWFQLQEGLLSVHAAPEMALFHFEDAVAGGVTLSEQHRATILAFARTAATEAQTRLETGDYPADLSEFQRGTQERQDRTEATNAFKLILTLEPDDAEAQAGLERLAS